MNVEEMIDLFRDYVSEDIDPLDKRETGVYWTTKRILRLLNVAQDYVQNEIANINQEYFISFFEGSGSNEYLLPEDFLRAVTVKSQDYLIDPIDLASAAIVTNDNKYYFQDRKIILPDGYQNIQMKYIRKIPNLVNRTDISQVPNEYHEYLVMYAVVNATTIDEAFNLSQAFTTKFMQLKMMLFNTVDERQDQQSRFVHADVIYM